MTEDKVDCPICLDIIDNDIITTSCNHRFHNTCFSAWHNDGNYNCPVCRSTNCTDLNNNPRNRRQNNLVTHLDFITYDTGPKTFIDKAIIYYDSIRAKHLESVQHLELIKGLEQDLNIEQDRLVEQGRRSEQKQKLRQQNRNIKLQTNMFRRKHAKHY